MMTSTAASSPVKIILITALDTTWRIFTPVLASVFIGIALDHWLGVTPLATIVCLVAGTFASAYLVTKQLKDVKKTSKGIKK